MEPPRFRGLPTAVIGGVRVPVAATFASRMLGLAFLDRCSAGNGLLIPRCRAIHSFGMRFDLQLAWLGSEGEIVREACVRPLRFASCREAAAVLELPSPGV